MKYRMSVDEIVAAGLLNEDEKASASAILRTTEASSPSQDYLEKLLASYNPLDVGRVGEKVPMAGVTNIAILNAGGTSVLYIGLQDAVSAVSRRTGVPQGVLRKELKSIGNTQKFCERHDTNLLNRLFANKYQKIDSKEGELGELAKIRFAREGEMLMKVRHQHVPRGFYADENVIVSEFLPLMTGLDRIIFGNGLQERQRTVRERAEIVRKTVKILAELYQKDRTLHRDLKPSNILAYLPFVANLTAKLIDFGLVSLPITDSKNDPRVTQAGYWEGTPKYFSPEEAVGTKKLYTPRSEVYVAAAIMLEAINRKNLPYYSAESDYITVTNIQEMVNGDQKFDLSIDTGIDVPPELREVLGKALQINPEKRYASCVEFSSALETVFRKWPLKARTGKSIDSIIIPESEIIAQEVNNMNTIIISRPGEGNTLCLIENPTMAAGELVKPAELVGYSGSSPKPEKETQNGTTIIDTNPEDTTPTIIRRDLSKIHKDTSAINLSLAEQESLMPGFSEEPKKTGLWDKIKSISHRVFRNNASKP